MSLSALPMLSARMIHDTPAARMNMMTYDVLVALELVVLQHTEHALDPTQQMHDARIAAQHKIYMMMPTK